MGNEFVATFLAFLADPNVAYLLLVLGLLGLIAEATTPGVTFPGVLGVLALLLSGYGLLHLPTNWLGLALIVAGILMFVLDIKVTGIVLSIGGGAAFLLGSLLLFTPPWVRDAVLAVPVARLNLWLIGVTSAAVAAFFGFGLTEALKAQDAPVAVGRETLAGRVGVVLRPLAPEGIVRLEGEEWTGLSAGGAIPVGAQVRVVRLDGLKLVVERVDDEPPKTPPQH